MQTAAQPFDILSKKIDVAFVCNEDGLELHSFSIDHIGDANEMVEKMTKRHQQKYTVQIKNVPAICAQAHVSGA